MGKFASARLLSNYLRRTTPLINQTRHKFCCPSNQPLHLICFKQWTSDMVLQLICSAINLKYKKYRDMNYMKDMLKGSRVLILQEVDEPVLRTAVSMAATCLGADINVIDNVMWKQDYGGCVLSTMADAVFLSTSTNWFLQRFADQSSVPVICMKSRTHDTIQSLATVMAIFEEFGSMCCLNLAYIGPPHPILNSYILLSSFLGANIKFKCCSSDNASYVYNCPVSPLLYNADKDMREKILCQQCGSTEEALDQANVIISGPTPYNAEKTYEYCLTAQAISKHTSCHWIYFHTGPRGKEVGDDLLNHSNARSNVAFDNLHFIAAALLASTVRRCMF